MYRKGVRNIDLCYLCNSSISLKLFFVLVQLLYKISRAFCRVTRFGFTLVPAQTSLIEFYKGFKRENGHIFKTK